MKALKISPTLFTLRDGFYNERKYGKGFKVRVDMLRFDFPSTSGILCRVVNMTKQPKWLDLGWFEEGKGIYVRLNQSFAEVMNGQTRKSR